MQQILIFLHIPKAGGNTLKSILNEQYREDERLRIYTYPHFSKDKGIERLKKLSIEEKSKLKLIYGHFAFGIHKYLSAEAKYITFLRNPVDRIISHFYYVKKHNVKEHIKNMEGDTFEEYLEKGLQYELNNGMTRLLCSEEKIQKGSTVTRDDLETAKRNIEKYFSFVGVLEEFHKGLMILNNMLGWGNALIYKRKNVTEHPKREEFPKHVINKIIQMNKLDIELYKYVRETYV